MLDFRVEKKPPTPSAGADDSAGGTTTKASKVLGETDSEQVPRGRGAMNWYSAALSKYAVFSGRAQRKEYWFFSFSTA